jgi:hypothetical protein
MTYKPNKPLLIGLAAASVVSAGFAWRDLNRRSDAQVRGSRKLWRVAMLLNTGNSVAYWVFGRR